MSQIAFRDSVGVGDSTPIVVSKNYDATFSLNMFKNIGSEGVVSWVDMGAEYDLINSKLNENTDLDMKDKLLRVKDKLLSMTYNPDEYVGDIDKVYQLKQSVATD